MSWLEDDNDYYSKFAISNSSLSALNPEQGGSPKRFQEFFERNKEKKTSLSLERGSLVHLYCENPDGFIVEDLDKPSEAVCKIIQYVYEGIKGAVYPDEKYLEERVVYLTLEGAKMLDYGKGKYSDERILKEVNDKGKNYLQFLIDANGKQIMSAETKKIVEQCIQSLHNNPSAEMMLFDKVKGEHIYNEQEVYWEERVGGADIPCKAKIDRLIINHRSKQIWIPDIKTTSKSAYSFEESFEFWRYYRQHAFYRKAVEMFFKQNFPDKSWEEYDVQSYNVVVETCDNPNTVVYEVPMSWIEKGTLEYESLLARYAWHAVHNDWSQSYEEAQNGGILILKAPEKVTNNLEITK